MPSKKVEEKQSNGTLEESCVMKPKSISMTAQRSKWSVVVLSFVGLAKLKWISQNSFPCMVGQQVKLVWDFRKESKVVKTSS